MCLKLKSIFNIHVHLDVFVSFIIVVSYYFLIIDIQKCSCLIIDELNQFIVSFRLIIMQFVLFLTIYHID